VCGGAGDAFLEQAAAAGADAYVTADLRHHYTTEHLSRGGPALVDPGHWATEWPWLERAGRLLSATTGDAEGEGTVVVHVSEVVTDPWTAHVTRETR
jgi:putative NIF3 family GTP cyclohydrolase 1 type 2